MPWLIWGIAARVDASVTGHWLVGYFAHNQGRAPGTSRARACRATDVPYAGFLTTGEAWHNNHHAFSGSAKLGLKEGETDPGGVGAARWSVSSWSGA